MSKEIVYTNQYVDVSRERLIEIVAQQMSEKRFAHVLRVEEMALELAGIHGGDLEKVSIAALVHDYAKERPDHDFIKVIQEKGFPEELLVYGNPIWHGLVGAEIISKELGMTDAEILNAVRLHTTGAADMTQLDKLIYVADYVESGRDFPVVNQAREIALTDLDEAVAFETKHTLAYLVEKEALIYPKTIETFNQWVVKK
ncbi:HD domain-containing protein [Vagococcus coleopterorum]|uniref:bis(5'-nucleosyl)-tetraphosphatase (symmetrical) n=1 Tax=Vagococcus coleopterorum TaxID=2714946 RepID=A0A6G8AN78_9ENTE|nr:bis(5'-nucleosyl)-tetraphosphatase (symmetrical) YqeK [Vagococcus coleopterorum]QIL46383.1 HD domain-containing protein [Vagococcus coleopterorum]